MALISIREALNQAMDEELERNPDVFIMGEEVGHYNGAYKVTEGLIDKFGDRRIIDTPIAESGFAGVGIGAAMLGLRPIIEFMTWNFALVAIDQILNNAAKLRYMSGGQFNLNLVFRGPQGAGGALAAQHSQIFENFYVYTPGLKVVAPSTAYDCKGLLKSSIRDDNPVIFLESEQTYNLQGEVPEEEYLIPLGLAEIKKEGNDVTIVAWSTMYFLVMKVAATLEKEGISAEVIDPRTLHPLDEDTILTSIQKTNRMVIVQESWSRCSMGEHIAHIITQKAFDSLDAPIQIVSSEDVPMPYSFSLEEMVLPSEAKIINAVRKIL